MGKIQTSIWKSCLCERVGIVESLKETEKAPTTMAYTQYLLQTAYSGTVPEILATILPCFWVYLDIGEHLDPRGTREAYKEWINMYSSEEYRDLVMRLRGDLNGYLKALPNSERRKVEGH